jgi:hypothetical protein
MSDAEMLASMVARIHKLIDETSPATLLCCVRRAMHELANDHAYSDPRVARYYRGIEDGITQLILTVDV